MQSSRPRPDGGSLDHCSPEATGRHQKGLRSRFLKSGRGAAPHDGTCSCEKPGRRRRPSWAALSSDLRDICAARVKARLMMVAPQFATSSRDMRRTGRRPPRAKTVKAVHRGARVPHGLLVSCNCEARRTQSKRGPNCGSVRLPGAGGTPECRKSEGHDLSRGIVGAAAFFRGPERARSRAPNRSHLLWRVLPFGQ